MIELEVLPPQLNVDINIQIRLRVLAGVLYELTEICGVHIEDDLSKGIIDRDVIEKITITFQDNEDNPCGRIHFLIDWEKFELLAKTDDSIELYKDIDFSNGYCNALDKKLLRVIKNHVKQLKKKYSVNTVICTFRYREKYTETTEIHDAARKYMGHVKGEFEKPIENKQFARSLQTVFKNMDGILNVKFEFD